jgi:hypothetical protein
MTSPIELKVPPYDCYTLFPFSLVEELVAVLRRRHATFECFADRSMDRGGRHWIIDSAREYARYKTGTDILPVAVLATALNRLARRAPRLAGVSRWLGWRQPRTPSVVLHHDADRQPHKTVDMMRLEERLGVVSSNYFFVQRCARWPGDDETYEVDFAALRELETRGFEIGYHLNTMERGGYDVARASAIAANDIAFLRQKMNLRTFVPHGGVPGPGGLNNEHTPYTGELASLVWAYSGRGFVNDAMWSDGYAEGEAALRLPDPRKVAASLRGRMRGHFLMHPQYYGHTLRADWQTLPISRLPWWRDLWGL